MASDKERTLGDSAETTDPDAMIPIFSSGSHDGEMEAMAVKGVLDANGIPAILVGPHVLPNLEFQIQVPANLEQEARQVIRDARQDGRKAADEGELTTENSGA